MEMEFELPCSGGEASETRPIPAFSDCVKHIDELLNKAHLEASAASTVDLVSYAKRLCQWFRDGTVQLGVEAGFDERSLSDFADHLVSYKNLLDKLRGRKNIDSEVVLLSDTPERVVDLVGEYEVKTKNRIELVDWVRSTESERNGVIDSCI